jgi:hypothetical protein
MKRILIGCEESQAVCIEFRKLGFEAFSCDIQECSGGHPEWHYQQDIFEVINMGWDAMIAFPPCTYLTVTGARWLYNKDKTRNESRWTNQAEAVEFVKKIYNSNIKHIAIENPIGQLSTYWKKPDQIIQPYYFGDEAQKATCLWLKNLPKLYHSGYADLFNNEVTHSGKGEMVKTKTGKTFSKWYWETSKSKGKERQIARSKTFPGIAKAMATHWGEYLLNQ